MEENREFGLSSFWLKILAIVCMTIDHATWMWYGQLDPLVAICLRSIGRFTFPIMVFLLTEGYVYTSNRIKYAGRLFAFALISMIPFYMMDGAPWNVMFTLFAGLSLLIIKDECVLRFKQIDERVWLFLFLMIAAALSWFMDSVDWGFPGVLAIYAGGQVKNKRFRALVITGVLFAGCVFGVLINRPFVMKDAIFYSGILLSTGVLLLYNGELGYTAKGKMKYAFYIYYPAHIFVLCMIYLISQEGLQIFL